MLSVARHPTPLGRLVFAGEPRLRVAAADLALAAAREGGAVCRPVAFDGGRAWLKASPLRGRARVRHALRMGLLRRAAPRVAELRNLTWLRAHGFGAPRPLAAGVFLRGGAPTWQFLLTEDVAGAVTLRDLLTGEGPDDATETEALRARSLDRLADELGRLHRLGFVHRDLFARNLLVRAPSSGGHFKVLFLDAWRGGPPPQLRPPSFDLACFLLHGAALLDEAEQRRFLERYLRARGAADLDREALAADVRAQRMRLARRVVRRGEHPELGPPPADWTWPRESAQ